MADVDLIQIVDDNDKPIKIASIAEAREQGLIHRIVRVMIENDKGELLLQKRTNKMTWPNCWDNSAAGHVNAGEDYLTAAKRELSEEIGIEGVTLVEIGTYFSDAMHKTFKIRRFNKVYRVKSNETPTKLQPEEVAEVRWLTIDAVKTLINEQPEKVTDGLSDVISRYY